LQSRTNLRTDRYGGSIENRTRLLLEITQAAIEVWGANRVGVRLSPYGVANGSGEAEPMPLYGHAIQSLDALGLAYLHFIEPRSSGAGRAEVNHQNVPSAMVLFRPIWSGVLISAGGFTGETGRDCGRPRRCHGVRPHLHLQSRPAAPPAARLSPDAL
jgi:N-ethylmaleimide reductase